jgi:hypothetical protein
MGGDGNVCRSFHSAYCCAEEAVVFLRRHYESGLEKI